MSEHTPTPWSVNTMAGNPKREIFSGLRLVCEVIGGQPHLLPENDPQEDAANAAFIVKAVNNHDALVEALKLARARIEYLGVACPNSKHFDANVDEFLPRIDAVLKRCVVGGPGHE